MTVTNPLINRAKKLFIDSVKIRVKGGNGGHGLPQYGGIGGQGGDVYVVAGKRPLGSINKQYPNGFAKAGDGVSSRKSNLVGASGKDLKLVVPVGVSVHDENRQLIGELNDERDTIIVAMGGRGGDKFNDNHGYVGQMRVIRLDLKMISDVGFVGFPNAGKSTLLGAVSRTRPRIADYPFTTLKPMVGVVKYSDDRAITMTDLPGLVEGAHKNFGLGFQFLKHIARTRLLTFVVDVKDVDLGPHYPKRTPAEVISILNKEIELYDDTILTKPSILLVSKMDTCDDAKERFEKTKQQISELAKNQRMVNFDKVIPISAKNNLNIEEFKNAVRETIDKYAEEEKLEQENRLAGSES